MVRRGIAALLSVALAATAAPIDPREEAFIGKRRSYWAFQPVVKPQPPEAGTWARTPVDAFILENLREKGLTPSPEAGKRELIRRLSFDLTGMAPEAAEVDTFLRDRSADAYEKLVDRLLASPAYGERWAMKWLDVVRYADTNGYEGDMERPQAWRYRDYVIKSFNTGKPFDRFLMEQIAGDELFPGDPEALIATGFHRAGPRHVVSGNQDVEMNRQEVLLEMTLGISNTFLGLTVGCARCHNHKFDPISQADHYRLQAFMAATDLKEIELGTEQEKKSYQDAKKAHEARLKPIQDEIAEIEKPYRERIIAERKTKLEPRFLEALAVPEKERSKEQATLAKEAMSQIKPTWDEVVRTIPKDLQEKRAGLRKQMHAIELDVPEPPITAFAVANMEKAPSTHILKVGDHRHKLDEVEPQFLTVLGGLEAPKSPSGRRAALAKWLADPQHPLTARVMANRIWQFRMGSGIVPTPNDFGLLGGRPTNRKLLDWLAAEFVEKGWSVKAMDRLIVTSAVYRQSAMRDEKKAAVDGDNKLYWRMNSRRLEGEALRDVMLQASGKLKPAMFGKPIKTPLEPEVYDLIFTEGEPDNLWPLPKDRSEIYRKSLYLLNKRTVRLPMLANFDQPDNITSCPVRAVSTHALQALTLLNSDFVQEQSRALAARVQGACGGKGWSCQADAAYRFTLQRTPKPAEKTMAREFLAGKKMPLEDFCKAMLNRHEFVYVP